MYLCRKTLENYKGTVILTSHSPCAKFKEKLAWLNPFDYKMLKKWVDRIEEMLIGTYYCGNRMIQFAALCITAVYAILTNVDMLKSGVNLVKSRLGK